MESAVFDFPHQSALLNYHQEDWEIPLLDNDDFQWIDDCMADSILPSSNLDYLPNEFFSENKDHNLGNDLENAKDDFNRVLEQWKLHLGDLQGLPMMPDVDNGPVESASTSPLPIHSSQVIDVPSRVDLGLNCGIDNSLLPLEQSPVLEALDVASLFEQFEASETCHRSQEKPGSDSGSSSVGAADRLQRSLSKTVELSTAAQFTRSSEFRNSTCKSAAIDDSNSSSPEISTHKLPIAQLPRFSIILKRDPIALHKQSPKQGLLREHDYCSSPKLTILPRASTNLASDASFTTSDFVAVSSKRMKSVLKPVSPPTSDNSVPESLYSKLPDYYTSVVPPKSTDGPPDSSKVPKEQSYNENHDKGYYDKLPLYLTTFVNTVCSLDSAVITRTPDEKTGHLENSKSCKELNSKASVLPLAARLDIEKNEGALQKCEKTNCDAEEMQSRKGHQQPKREVLSSRSRNSSCGSLTRQWKSKAQCRSRQWSIRQTSSLSPSRSVSSRSQSRSRSRSSERSVSSSSSSSSSSHSPVRRHSPLVRHSHKRHLQSRNPQRNTHTRIRTSETSKWEYDHYRDDEQKKQIEDRRVVHVGNIKAGTSRADLGRRFGIFGPIEDITLHFREHGDCFAFVTFSYKVDAFEALEHGNDDGFYPKYELSLGGRRLFCLEQYSDLDSLNNNRKGYAPQLRNKDSFNFDDLLKSAKENLRKVPH